MKVISVSMQKGGVSKSTTALALLTGLRDRGFKTVAVDLDPQLTLCFLTDAKLKTNKSLYEVMTKGLPITEAIQHTEQGDVISSGENIFNIDKDYTKIGKEYQLAEAIKPLKDIYDFILIDTAPNLGLLSINALTCSDYVIIPSLADVVSMIALQQIQETIEAVKRYTNKDLKTLGILLTRFNDRTLLNREVLEMLQKQAAALGTKVFNTKIRETVLVKQAQANFESIYTYCPKATATQDYLKFIDELLEDLKK